MNCSDLENQLHEFVDNELARDKRREVANHLATCRHCSVRVAELEQVDRELRSLPMVEPPSDFVQQVRRKLREQEEENAAPAEELGAASETAPKESLWETFSRRFAVPLWVRVPLSLAAAAVLVFAIVTLIQSHRQQQSSDLARLPDLGMAKPVRNDFDLAKAAEGLGRNEPKNGAGATALPESEQLHTAEIPKPIEPSIVFPELAVPAETTGVSSASKTEGVDSRVTTLAQQPPLAASPDPSNATVAATGVTPPASPQTPPMPMAKGVPKKSPETHAKLGPMATNVPPGLQAGWLDLATLSFYPEVGKNPENAAYVRGYLDAKGKFKLLSTQVEGPLIELDARQASARGKAGWLALSTQSFVSAKPGLRPSFPYIEGYQDERGEFHPTSRRIYKAAN